MNLGFPSWTGAFSLPIGELSLGLLIACFSMAVI
jgi:hypothetical protein